LTIIIYKCIIKNEERRCIKMSLNKVFLVGRLTKDVEKRPLQSGQFVTNFTLAVDRNYTNKEGVRDTDFIPVTAWGRLAEVLEQYTEKGTLVSVVGRLQGRSYKDKSGKNVRIFEVVAEEVSFLAKPQSRKENKPVSESKTEEEKADFIDEDFQEITDESLEDFFKIFDETE
jgi:single-strand DNA-binding protein